MVERTIVIAQNDAFVLVQTVYALAVAVGTWLPWVCLALLAAGVFVAKRRTVALVWTAAGLALTMLILAAGLGIGRTFFIGTVSPSIMPSDTASVLFDGLVELMLSTIVAFLVLSILVAVIAWFSGPWRPARAAREFAGAGFASARRAAARHGVTTGSFGIGLDRWRGAVYIAIALIAAAVVLFNRPVTVGAVIWTVIVALIAVVIVRAPAPTGRRGRRHGGGGRGGARRGRRGGRWGIRRRRADGGTRRRRSRAPAATPRRPSLRVRPILHVAPTERRPPG